MQVGSFTSSAQAEELCGKLSAAGGQCIVQPRDWGGPGPVEPTRVRTLAIKPSDWPEQLQPAPDFSKTPPSARGREEPAVRPQPEPDAADRRFDPGLSQAFGVFDRDVLGRFKWSSQRLMRSYDDQMEAAIGSFSESSIALARSTTSGRA